MADDPLVSITIDTNDLYRTAKKLKLVPAFKAGVKAAGIYLMGVMKVYPPATEANMPKAYPGRWYERGYGTRWEDKDGNVMGRRTSQTLFKRWATRKIDEGLGVEIGNNAGYGPYVHDKPRQARFHGLRGWPTVQDKADSEAEKVTEIISDFIAAAIEERSKPRS